MNETHNEKKESKRFTLRLYNPKGIFIPEILYKLYYLGGINKKNIFKL